MTVLQYLVDCVPLQQSDVLTDESFSVLLCNDSEDRTFKQKQVE